MGRSAAFFDLDKTILTRSSTLAFGRPMRDGGLINRRTVLKGVYAQAVYLTIGADQPRLDRIRDRLAALCAGWEVAQVREIVRSSLHEIIDPMVYAEATTLINQHRGAGRDVIIVSSSGEDVVGPIGEMLEVDGVIATRMVVADGRYTGEVAFYAYGENKARAVRALAATRGYRLPRCYAYSDSVTDLPLLETVGYPTAVNPDRSLRRIAVARGWPVLTFDRPTIRPGLPWPPGSPRVAGPTGPTGSSRSSTPSTSDRSAARVPTGPLVAGAAAGITVAGVVWCTARYRHSRHSRGTGRAARRRARSVHLRFARRTRSGCRGG